MYRFIFVLLIASLSVGQTVRKSPVDLLREGRFLEAQRILEESEAPERYHLLLDALREPNAIEACFLYREISARFPGTDCDEFAQERLLQAASMGIDISSLVLESTPVAEPGQWTSDEQSTYEMERPLIASVTRDALPNDETASELTVSDSSDQAKRLDTTPASSESLTDGKEGAESITLDYGKAVEARTDTGIMNSSLSSLQASAAEPESVRPLEEPKQPHDVVRKNPLGWYVQVGAFALHDNAHKIAAKLRSEGFDVFLVPRDNLMQVRVGTFESKEQARAVGDKIKAKFDVPAVLVTVP